MSRKPKCRKPKKTPQKVSRKNANTFKISKMCLTEEPPKVNKLGFIPKRVI